MADPTQTPQRGEWACPCAGCAKAVSFERKTLIEEILKAQKEYLKYRGGSFNEDGTLYWAKDDAMAYAEGMDAVIELIRSRMPKPKEKKTS